MIMAFEFEKLNMDDLLDDPVETVEEEPTVEPTEEEVPILPDQESDVKEEAEQDGQSEEATAGDSTEEAPSVLYEYLQSYGIKDPSKIQFENESGTIDEVDFNSLSREEQLTMLKELSNTDYTDYERSVINYMRQNKTDLEGIVKYFSDKAVQDYLAQNPDAAPQKTYTIDDYSDDELYMADMKARFPDFTDEEIESKLDSAKLNEETFKKEIDAIRQYYKTEEDKQAEEARLQEQQQYESLRNSILDATSKFNEIVLDADDPTESLEIEDSDKQIMLDYLLAEGTDGRSQFDKDLSDPAALIELAWLRTHGRETLTSISQYWKHELAETRKELAKAQKELDKYTKNDKSVIVEKPKSKKNDINSIHDIWVNANY